MSLKGKAAVTGVGDTRYSRQSGKSVTTLQMEASLAAIRDAGLDPKDIDGIIAYGSMAVVAEDFITSFGIADLKFSAVTPLGGASAVAAAPAHRRRGGKRRRRGRHDCARNRHG